MENGGATRRWAATINLVARSSVFGPRSSVSGPSFSLLCHNHQEIYNHQGRNHECDCLRTRQPGRGAGRTARLFAHPERVHPERAPKGCGACRALAPAGAGAGGAGKHRHLADGGAPGRLRRLAARARRTHRARLWALRRAAARPARPVGKRPLRADGARRQAVRARLVGRQGAAVHPRQGAGSADAERGPPARQHQGALRGGGGDRQRAPGPVDRGEPGAPGGGRGGYLRQPHLEPRAADHRLRAARPLLHRGACYQRRARPALRRVRRRGPQPDPGAERDAGAASR